MTSPWHTRLRCKGICCWLVWRPHLLVAPMVHTKICSRMVAIGCLSESLIPGPPEWTSAPARSSPTQPKGQRPVATRPNSASQTRPMPVCTASASPTAMRAQGVATGLVDKVLVIGCLDDDGKPKTKSSCKVQSHRQKDGESGRCYRKNSTKACLYPCVDVEYRTSRWGCVLDRED